MKKKWIAIALSATLAMGTCLATACNGNDENRTEKQAYVSLDINPAVELIVDKNDVVVSVRGENEDGQVLLYGETEIKGEKIDAAVQKITDLAVQYGYLDEENTVVDALVTSGNDEFAEKILGKVNASVVATAENLGLSVSTDGEGAYSLLRRMEAFKKQFPDNAAIQNLSASKFKLALSVSETGDISLEAAVALDEAELIKMLEKASSNIEAYATDAYLQAKAKALAAYEQATELAGYAVYGQYYLEKMLTHPLTSYYGGVYQAYATAAKALRAVCDVAEVAATVKNYPLDEERVAAIALALGMESADELKNSDGKITVASVEAYADKLFKNSEAGEALEQKKAALSAALAQAETVAKEEANELSEAYKPQIEAAVATARQVLTTMESLFVLVPENVTAALHTATADLKEILAAIDEVTADGKIELDELKEQASRLEAKANEYLEKIKADLSEEERKELEERKAKVVAAMTQQKQAFEKALDDAAKAAKDYLADLKAERKQK